MIAAVSDAHAQRLAAIHAEAFDAPWDAQTVKALLGAPGVMALADGEDGFLLIRVVADEAEILTLATRTAARRRGVGWRLVLAAAAQASRCGAQRLFLEVAADNGEALRLYRRANFMQAGLRKGYYSRPGGERVDALVLARALEPPA
jgi:ribosomal-protein-alanine N-acetyltransferase